MRYSPVAHPMTGDLIVFLSPLAFAAVGPSVRLCKLSGALLSFLASHPFHPLALCTCFWSSSLLPFHPITIFKDIFKISVKKGKGGANCEDVRGGRVQAANFFWGSYIQHWFIYGFRVSRALEHLWLQGLLWVWAILQEIWRSWDEVVENHKTRCWEESGLLKLESHW